MIDKRVGKRIKQYRERLGLTQEEFAEKTGLASGYISTVERGITFPRYDKLITIIITNIIHNLLSASLKKVISVKDLRWKERCA